ncbi:MAG: hypothetical protein KJZ83_10700 [Burkholderiaceae bacterium]|nr:hypothetical protein [Burkholderiaceae bacterium]
MAFQRTVGGRIEPAPARLAGALVEDDQFGAAVVVTLVSIVEQALERKGRYAALAHPRRSVTGERDVEGVGHGVLRAGGRPKLLA